MELMNKPYIQYNEIDIGFNQHLTYTQQYITYKKWYIGYNSYWDKKQPYNHHSIFIDLDNTDEYEIKLIVKAIKDNLEHYGLYKNIMGFVLRSSTNHYHIIIPHKFPFKDIIYLYMYLYEITEKESIHNYTVNCINRNYSTLRFSQKDNTSIKGVTIFHITTRGDKKYYNVNYYHWELLKSFYADNPLKLADILMVEKNIKKVKANNKFMTYYADKGTL